MRDYTNIKTVVLKIGSSSLLNSANEIDKEIIKQLAIQIKQLIDANKNVILVTSGAVAVGRIKLNIKPKNIEAKQACAAVGQASLINIYDNVFEKCGINCAQILVNHDDFDHRNRMLNLKNTLNFLMKEKVVPIINENDALATEEIKVGDNDTLAALVTAAINAELLILLSDVDGLYSKNPQVYNDAILIDEVNEITKEIENMASISTTKVGTGGMATKIKAAKITNSASSDMIIMSSTNIDKINDVILGSTIGTLFKGSKKIKSKNHWMLYNSSCVGTLIIDEGAVSALINGRKSLLPSGVVDVLGIFNNNTIVAIKDLGFRMIAKGIVNYNSEEIRKLKGQGSDQILNILGYINKEEVIHANDMILINGDKDE